jgi:hypothetical protein
MSGFSNDTYGFVEKVARTSEVLPDCRGPVTTTTGKPLARRSRVVDNLRGIMAINVQPVEFKPWLEFNFIVVKLQENSCAELVERLPYLPT